MMAQQEDPSYDSRDLKILIVHLNTEIIFKRNLQSFKYLKLTFNYDYIIYVSFSR